MGSRRCPARYCPRITTERYCPEHMAEYEAKRGTPRARGYDAQHRALRSAWQARIDAGEIVYCTRCGGRLTGSAWDLGHATDRTKHTGPECVGCNRRAGGQDGRARQTAT